MARQTVNDPYFPWQWFLQNAGQTGGKPDVDLRVIPAWADYDGSGVVVAVVDDGLEFDHPDLAANIDPSLSFAAYPARGDGQPLTDSDEHGVAVAGIIAAATGNGLGVAGGAGGATLASVRLSYDDQSSDPDQEPGIVAGLTDALNRGVSDYDVINNSWNFFGKFFSINAPANAALKAALENAATNGRDGKGAVVVFSAGNHRLYGHDANMSNLTNSPETITVGAVDMYGLVSAYSSPGDCVLVSAPSDSFVYAPDGSPWSYGGIVTTDRMGELGYNTAASPAGDYCGDFGGTSAAAPQISAVVALMLEANPDLGYRDVQEILALCARNTADANGWTINAAGNWNGGGMHASHSVGFGLADATAAVRLAETWTEQKTAANLLTASSFLAVNLPLPDGMTVTTVQYVADEIVVERAEVVLALDKAKSDACKIWLVSPSGTESLLLDMSVSLDVPTTYSLTSTHFLGESGKGVWTLRFEDKAGTTSEATLGSWQLNLYGHAQSQDDTYYYTNEYAEYATEDRSRAILSDASGTDAINAAAVSGDVTCNLNPGLFSLIDGAVVYVTPDTVIENALCGDGDDVLLGNAADNSLFGGRGDDLFCGGPGDDVLDGGQSGFDVAFYPGAIANYAVSLAEDGTVTVSGPAGRDVLKNMDALLFDGGPFFVAASA